MSDFAYLRPGSLQEAIARLDELGPRGRILAGGTDLINRFRAGEAACDCVVDVAHMPELRAIEANDQITVGAAVTHTEIVESQVLQQSAPLLVRACREIGSPQIRNVATIGGNVANAAACADTAPALVCLSAEAIIVTAEGEHRLPVADLITGVNRTSLPPGGLIRAFVFDPAPAGSRTSYVRIGRRQSMSIARLSLAAMGALDDGGQIAFVRLVPGAVFARFRQVAAVEEMLLGRAPTAALFKEAGKQMAGEFWRESGGRWSAPYKERVIAVLTERALQEVFGS